MDTSLTLECPAPEGYPPVDVRWYLNSVELTSVTPGVELSLGGRQLVVQPLSTAHAGLYRCEASNEAGARSSEDLDIQVTRKFIAEGGETHGNLFKRFQRWAILCYETPFCVCGCVPLCRLENSSLAM